MNKRVGGRYLIYNVFEIKNAIKKDRSIIELTIVWPGFESMLLDMRAIHLTVYWLPLVDTIIHVEQLISCIISFKKVNMVYQHTV